MNERIKELYLHTFPPSLNDSTTVQMSAEKFAELIVKECAGIFAQEGTGRYEVDGNWIAKTIKQHFGVEL
jgi:hypothetical protein